MHKLLVSSIACALGLVGCGVSPSVPTLSTVPPSVASPTIPAVTALATQPVQPVIGATAQATPFDGAPTIEREQCCVISPTGMIDRLSVRLDAFSTFGPVEAVALWGVHDARITFR